MPVCPQQERVRPVTTFIDRGAGLAGGAARKADTLALLDACNRFRRRRCSGGSLMNLSIDPAELQAIIDQAVEVSSEVRGCRHTIGRRGN